MTREAPARMTGDIPARMTGDIPARMTADAPPHIIGAPLRPLAGGAAERRPTADRRCPADRRSAAAWANAAAPTIAGWLLAAVGVDLLVTRLFLRLAIFIPKSDAAAGVVGLIARVAAIVDTLVPVVGVLLLGVLLASAGARPSAGARRPFAGAWRPRLFWRLGLVATSGVAAGGFALTVLAPTPAGMVVLEGIVATAALLFAALAVRASAGLVVRIGLGALGVATALASLARVVEAAAVLSGTPAVAEPSLAIFLVGELTFTVGAITIGVAGLLAVPTGSRPFRIGTGAGILVGVALVGASLAVPATASIILIWSVGLVSGLVPLPLAALVAGLAVMGLVALGSERRDLVVGLGIVLLAGYGLAASGLVLAGLLGLAVASRATWLDGMPQASGTARADGGRGSPSVRSPSGLNELKHRASEGHLFRRSIRSALIFSASPIHSCGCPASHAPGEVLACCI